MMLGNQKKSNKKRKNNEGSDFEISGASQRNDSCDNQSDCVKQQKKIRIKLKKQRIYKKMNQGAWSPEEESKFLEFMIKYKSIFQDKELRRVHTIFRKMRYFIKTRSHQQCRSHHQKYEQRFLNFDEIVRYLKAKLQQQQRIASTRQQNIATIQQRSIIQQIPMRKKPGIAKRKLMISTENILPSGLEEMPRKRVISQEEQKQKDKLNGTQAIYEPKEKNENWKMICLSNQQYVLKIDFLNIDSL